jgi:hypothetical protein
MGIGEVQQQQLFKVDCSSAPPAGLVPVADGVRLRCFALSVVYFMHQHFSRFVGEHSLQVLLILPAIEWRNRISSHLLLVSVGDDLCRNMINEIVEANTSGMGTRNGIGQGLAVFKKKGNPMAQGCWRCDSQLGFILRSLLSVYRVPSSSRLLFQNFVFLQSSQSTAPWLAAQLPAQSPT